MTIIDAKIQKNICTTHGCKFPFTLSGFKLALFATWFRCAIATLDRSHAKYGWICKIAKLLTGRFLFGFRLRSKLMLFIWKAKTSLGYVWETKANYPNLSSLAGFCLSVGPGSSQPDYHMITSYQFFSFISFIKKSQSQIHRRTKAGTK